MSVTVALLSILSTCASFSAGERDVLFAKGVAPFQLLHGEWKFKYLPSTELKGDESFYLPTFDATAWNTIPVPSHWELHGFAEPHYKKVDEGTGLYRRTFRVPGAWRGQRVMLRFDGVLYGLSVWINGKPVGAWASSYNPVTFDVTDALLAGDVDNCIAVRVTTRSKGYEFDTNDCWALSGIFREVTLFCVPQTHLKDYTAQTTLRPDGTAEVKLLAESTGGSAVSGRLVAPDGSVAANFEMSLGSEGRGTTTFAVPRPRLWTAETPSLYQLELVLKSGNQVVQQFKERIGLRQITIADSVLKLNGVPIKLRGINHHDIWPLEGRVATEELLRRDLELMRDANINFIRTSHYPPHPRFIELCDEMGFYVMCEVPFGYGDTHLNDTSYQEILLDRARATVMRDKNRPSVIVWSIGNENPLTDLTIKTALRARTLDPTRPVCFPTMGSYFRENLNRYKNLPESVGIFAPHYPGTKTIQEYAAGLPRPIIFTEYAHALALAADKIQVQWELMRSSPRVAGGAIWLFQDQGILRESKKPVDPSVSTSYAWKDSIYYYDSYLTDGVDGIVYSDRTPQPDYWQVRKVYAPVRILEHRLPIRSGQQTIQLHVENRYDFLTLSGTSLRWSLRINGAEIQNGIRPLSARPHEIETVPITVTLPADLSESILALNTSYVNGSGRIVDESTIRLDAEHGGRLSDDALKNLSRSGELRIEKKENVTLVIHPNFSVSVRQDSGTIEFRTRDGNLMASGLYPHIGHKFTMAEELRVARRPKKSDGEDDLQAPRSSIWRGTYLYPSELKAVEVSKTSEGARIRVAGTYPRIDSPRESLQGEFVMLISSKGIIDITYDYAPVNASGTLLEAGLSFVVPQHASELRWIGDGPFPGYPGKDALNEFGIYHMNRKDIRFQGNHTRVDLAALTNPSGGGMLLAGDAMNIAVENGLDATTLSHNALLSGRGNKGSDPELSVNAASVKRITGTFSVALLDSRWPAVLTKWLGPAGRAAVPFQPYYHSYDQ
jgi:beta-galactosidase